MKYELPKLKFEYNALEPYIDLKTMEIHYSKHHAAYVEKLNTALQNYSEFQGRSPEELLGSLDLIPEAIRTAVRNNGGGHFNHSFFWTVMGKEGRGEPQGSVLEAIKKDFGGFPNFREEFTKTATGIFGSGWAWLVRDTEGKLKIMTTPNQDSPVSQGLHPVLVLDAWEHAYYIKYQNRRPEYVEAWWNVIDWNTVGEHFAAQ